MDTAHGEKGADTGHHLLHGRNASVSRRSREWFRINGRMRAGLQ